MVNRTFGWIQNPSNFDTLKKVVQIFDNQSEHYSNLRDTLIDLIPFEETRRELAVKLKNGVTTFSYVELVGTSRDKDGKSAKDRKSAVADALIQISILPQNYKTSKKRWTDNWTSDGFLRWAVSFNFISHDRNTDTYSITAFGMKYSQSDKESETEILKTALLSYPPATQILNLLSESKTFCTKFYLGARLGFRGEKGFTSYNEDLMFDWIMSVDAQERKKIKSDVEGTSDKYARMISNWLIKVGFVQSGSVGRVDSGEKRYSFTGYKITGSGDHAIKQANGSSKNKRIEKFLMWEFLATHGSNRDYIRTRRAYIIKILQKTQSKSKLMQQLKSKGFNDDEKIILSDIEGLITFGLRISLSEGKIVLQDKVCDFSIPDINVTPELKDEKAEATKLKFMKQTSLPKQYIELLEIAYDGSRNRDFEIITMELFREVYRLNTKLLGGGRKPDGLVYTDKFGIIVDTKAYSGGYSKNISQADEMHRYIEDNKKRDEVRNPTKWWENFPESIEESKFFFMWISSKFTGKFHEQLEYTHRESKISGAALNVEQLLLGADMVLKRELNPSKLPEYIRNKEIYFKEID